MNKATLVYSDRMTNWPVIGSALVGGLALALFGRPWAGPWPGMAVPLAILLILLTVGLVTSTSLRVTAGHAACRSPAASSVGRGSPIRGSAYPALTS